jgi:predicted metal-dependent phosphoesterase TrpH
MIDLHTHSIYSDGTNTPGELVAMADKGGLAALALTDHDTVGGVPELLEAGASTSVEIVPGIELSAMFDHGTMHILGYFVDHTNPSFLEKVKKIQMGREVRNHEILKKLNKLGYRLLWDDIQKQAGKDVVGRPHIAAALVENGHVKTRKAAFDKLLAKGRPGYASRESYSPEECIRLIHEAGGVSSLAHPATINLSNEQLRTLLAQMKEMGLGGLEVYYGERRPDNMRKFSQWAIELDLIRTGGTDYHGANTPDLRVGTGFGKLRVPDEALAEIKAARPAKAG